MENTIEKLQKKINRLEKEMQERKVQSENILNSLFVGIAIHVNNKIVLANRSLIDLTGGNSETDLLGRNILEFVYSEDRIKVKEAFSKPDSGQNEVSNVIEGRLIKTDDSEIIAEFSTILINYYGKPALMVMINDITERKQAEEKLKKKGRQLRQKNTELKSFVNNIPDMAWLKDKNSNFIIANKAFGNAVGMSPEYLANQTCEVCFGKEAAKKFKEDDLKVMKGKKQVIFEESIKDAQGNLINLETIKSPIFSEPGDIIGTVGIARDITKRKQAEEEIRKLSQAVETTPQAIIIADLNGIIEYVNPGLLTMGGYDDDSEIINKPIFLFSNKEGIKQLKEEIIPTLLSDGQWKGEITIKRKDGSIFPAEMICSIILDENKQTKYLLSHFNNITERKLTEEELRESEKKFRDLANLLPQIVYEIDVSGNLTFVNKQAFDSFGYSQEEFEKGFNVFQVLIPEDRDKAKENIQNILQRKDVVNFEYTALRKDGSTFPILIYSSAIIKNNKLVGLRGIIVDITESKQAEETLKQSEKNYRDLFNNASDTIYIQDREYRFLDVNQGAVNMYGYPKEFFTGKTPEFLSAPGKNDMNKIKGFIEDAFNNQPRQYDFWGIRKNNEVFPKIVRSQKGFYMGKEVVVTYAIDITERKQAEEQLAAQNKEYASLNEEYQLQNQELISALKKAEESDRLKTEFINNMSHEIRTPMNGILGFLEFLNKPDLSDKKRKYYISIIKNSGNQLMQIINDILEISELRTKQVITQNKNVCLNDLLLELFSIFDIKAKECKTPLYLIKGLSDEESTIYTDEIKLNKIMSNLLENALKFTNVGFIEFGYQLINNNIEIYVKDTGIGINTNKQETIFERFSQEEKELSRKVGGLGLGLSIAKENAELIGGKITLKSEKGKGSTFFITIPYKLFNSETGKSNLYNENEKITEKQDKYTILIVEDEEVSYLYIETLLKDIIEIQCNIIHSKNGKEAVDLCETNSEIDFVLMDIKMPVMNGHEATKLIKEFRPDLSIVAQTAYSIKEDKVKAMSAGCDDFISKPISEETLNEIINKYLIKK